MGAKDLPREEEQYDPQACVKTIPAKWQRTHDSLLHCPTVAQEASLGAESSVAWHPSRTLGCFCCTQGCHIQRDPQCGTEAPTRSPYQLLRNFISLVTSQRWLSMVSLLKAIQQCGFKSQSILPRMESFLASASQKRKGVGDWG